MEGEKSGSWAGEALELTQPLSDPYLSAHCGPRTLSHPMPLWSEQGLHKDQDSAAKTQGLHS